MEMTGRRMEGYVFVDPPPHDEQALRDWLALAVAFVKTLPPKLPKSKPDVSRPNHETLELRPSHPLGLALATHAHGRAIATATSASSARRFFLSS
jgi:hypothetical protein